MKAIEILFWICFGLVAYTFVGYGILLWVAVRIKEFFVKPRRYGLPSDLPEVTLLIAAYNEESVVAEKMANCRGLNYPADRLRIVWVTDGSTDDTVKLLSAYQGVAVLHQPRRGGKAAALNRAMPYIATPITIFTDANTMLCPQAVLEIVRSLADPAVGCVAGEKRIAAQADSNAASGEGVYWRYESVLKDLDARLYSTVGAAGELFAIRTHLYVPLPEDTLLDDFVLSLEIVKKGYRIGYCREAYATETASADMAEEAKRKVRISAGGFQAMGRLKGMFNIFRHGVFSVQFISRKAMRWAVAPVALFMLLPLNVIMVSAAYRPVFYGIVLALQALFYASALYGYSHSADRTPNRLAGIAYYFLFMNVNALKGIFYLKRNKGRGTWEKARRAGI